MIQVTLSEELVGSDYKTSTELLYPMRTGNTYRSLWTTTSASASALSSSSDIVFEHHEYMEFRYAELLILSHGDAHPLYDRPPFSLTAWTVAYPYFDGDSFFNSSDSTLNAVWKLCQHTIRVTSLDTQLQHSRATPV